jgi:hypothetical protein
MDIVKIRVVLQICRLKREVSDLAFALLPGGKRTGVQRKKDFAQRRKARKDSQRFLIHLDIICET